MCLILEQPNQSIQTGKNRNENQAPIRTTLAALLLTGATIFATISPAQADALEDIKQAGVINVGVFADFPPFSSASADMSLKGYDVDVAQYIADSLGVEMNLVGVTGQNRIPYLNDHRVDLLMSVGYSAERAEVIDFAARLRALLHRGDRPRGAGGRGRRTTSPKRPSR